LSDAPTRLRSSFALTTAVTLAASLGLAACGTTSPATTGSTGFFSSSAPAQGRTVQMLVASTRPSEDGTASAREARYASAAVSVPPGHEPGAIERPSFGSANPRKHFAVVSQRPLEPDLLVQEVATRVSGRVGTSRDVLVFVHGYNVSYDDARFRLAQIVADGGFTGVPVLFTWPSQSRILAYGADKESATAARDPLEQLLLKLASAPGVGRVHVLAHSMGTWIAMEALRQNAIAGHADLNGHIGEIMLAAPDIDIDVFRGQMARLGKVARVSVFAASDDRALSVSSTLAGSRTRLGALDLSNKQHVDELTGLNVRVYDLSKADSTDFFRHGTFAEAPEVVKSIGAQLAEAPKTTDGTAAPQAQAQSWVDPQAAELANAPAPGTITSEALPPPGPVVPADQR
jgi:esterase/lipase superfamily enzyme